MKDHDANPDLWQHGCLGSDAQHGAPAGSTAAIGLHTSGTAYDATSNSRGGYVWILHPESDTA